MNTATANLESHKTQIAAACAHVLLSATVEQLQQFEQVLTAAGIDEYIQEQETPTTEQSLKAALISVSTDGMSDDDKLEISSEALQRGLEYSVAMMQKVGLATKAPINSGSSEEFEGENQERLAKSAMR